MADFQLSPVSDTSSISIATLITTACPVCNGAVTVRRAKPRVEEYMFFGICPTCRAQVGHRSGHAFVIEQQ